VAPWRWIFCVLTLFGIATLTWAALRLPETLPPARRRPIALAPLAQALRDTLRQPTSIGYTLAQMTMVGGLFGYINSAQQLFTDVFHASALFPLAFAIGAGSMAVASLVNSRIVVRLGSRRVSHSALLAYVALALVTLGLALADGLSMWGFVALQSLLMGCFGLAVSNFGALAMGPVGHVAGIASSLQGFTTTFGGALLGFVVGQHFDGTARPLALGYAVLALVALALVLATERGRLMGPTPSHAPLPADRSARPAA